MKPCSGVVLSGINAISTGQVFAQVAGNLGMGTGEKTVKKYTLIFLILMLSSCVSGQITKETSKPDGTTERCSASYFSFYKDLDKADIKACDASGIAKGSISQTAAVELLLKLLRSE